MNISIRDISFALLNCWREDTAIRNQWVKYNPSMNQCVGTVLIVQDYFQGIILRCSMQEGGSHYWNKLNTIGEIDLTFTQFGYLKKTLLNDKTSVSREYILSFEDNKKKYKILKNRVEKYLKEV